jgi:protein MPE1
VKDHQAAQSGEAPSLLVLFPAARTDYQSEYRYHNSAAASNTMSSSVFFKFKSQKEPTRVEFDGTTITVFELKRDIILKSGLGDGTDFDLAIYTEDGGEEYDDDTALVPRSTTVIARRLPALKPGHGRAARYVSGKMPIHAKNSARREPVSKALSKATTSALPQLGAAMTAEEETDAFLQMQSEQWAAQNEEMASKTAVYKPGGGKKPINVPDHEPPPGYICYRCGEKGHWIQQCPTNDNPEYDNRPRVKRTTGIPKSFLRTVDKATALSQLGATSEDDIKSMPGVMVNADGDFVVAEPDKAAWEQFQAKTKSSASAAKAANENAKELEEKGLLCSIDRKMFVEPMKTPCCGKTYCNECITNALIESDFICPNCGTDGVLIDDLKPDEEAQAKIKEFLEEKAAAKEEKRRSQSPADAKSPAPVKQEDSPDEVKAKNETDDSKPSLASPKSPIAAAAGSKSPVTKTEAGGSPADSTKPAVGPVVSEDDKSKKRPAEEEAENPKIPKAPKAMNQQDYQQGMTPQDQMAMMQQMMNGMPGMPPMNGMNGMNGMASMAGFPNMPMMPFPGMPGMNGMPMGMPGLPPNMNMGMGMGMPPMMGMPGGMPMNPGMMNPGMMNPMMGMPGFNGNMGGGSGNFNNGGGSGPQWGNGQNGGGNEEDSPYFRKPVNPQRHQKRRARPTDYRTLGS